MALSDHKAGAVSQWRRDRARSGVEVFLLQVLRHDRATKRLRQERNLKAVQRVLNHASITTTAPLINHQINILAQFYQRAFLLKKIQAQ